MLPSKQNMRSLKSSTHLKKVSNIENLETGLKLSVSFFTAFYFLKFYKISVKKQRTNLICIFLILLFLSPTKYSPLHLTLH